MFLLFIGCASCFSQGWSSGRFIIANDTIPYEKIDYGKYGLAHIYVTMYEQSEANVAMVTKAAECLKPYTTLYHTLYYFIGVPKTYTIRQREMLFSEFAKHITSGDDVTERTYLSLNFDTDYSGKYVRELIAGQAVTKIARIHNDIKPATICGSLIWDGPKKQK